jgi:hypothetical protein
MPGTCQCNGFIPFPANKFHNKYVWKRKGPFAQHTLPIIQADHAVTTAPQRTELLAVRLLRAVDTTEHDVHCATAVTSNEEYAMAN